MPRRGAPRPRPLPVAICSDELSSTVHAYRKTASRKNQRKKETVKSQLFAAARVAEGLSVGDSVDLCDREAGVASLMALAVDAHSKLGGVCQSQMIGPSATRVAELVQIAARRADWSVYELFGNLLVPTLVAMKTPKTQAFGLVLATAKRLREEDDWPDPDTQRAKALAEYVFAHLCSGPDVATGAWLMANLKLDRWFDFEDLFTRLVTNLQALRLYCVYAESDRQYQAVKRFLLTAEGEPRKKQRAIYSAAADIIMICKLDRQEFPAVARYKAINWLCYTLHRVPWQVSDDYANGDTELLVLCVQQLHEFGDLDGATAIFSRHKDQLIGKLRSNVEAALAARRAPLEEQDDFGPREVDSLALPLEERCVIWANTAALVAGAEAAVSAASVVGVDLEWTSMGDWLDPELALLQLAVPGQVFLVDLLAEGVCSAVDSLLRVVLGRKRPLTLCFSFRHDLRELARSPWAATCNSLQGICDLELLADERSGLSSLARKTLHKPVCKVEQRSCWARRPLRASQRHYAAMDAYVMLMVGAAMSKTPVTEQERMALALEKSLSEMPPKSGQCSGGGNAPPRRLQKV